jgi:hypothetical protein
MPISQADRDRAPPGAPALPDFLNVNFAGSCTAHFINGGVRLHTKSELQETPGLNLQRDANNERSWRLGVKITKIGDGEPTYGPLEGHLFEQPAE